METLPKVFNRFENIICYVGSQSINEPFSNGNVHFSGYFPSDEILPHSVAFMCHGGLNSITQSLEAGVPLIIFPSFIFERRLNAESVKSLGCGYLGEMTDFNEEWIADKIESIDKLKAKTKEIQSKFKNYSGTDTAYKYIMEWIKSSR